jgi:LmbE family N-acetylglucosaminyl deacetylase
MKRSKIILSPHCDDALLALGGSIQLWQPCPITVLTLFGTCAWTVGDSKSHKEITALNRKEEKLALSAAGCASVCLEYKEVLLRGYSEWNAVPGKSDSILQNQLERELLEKIPSRSEVYIPLAIGGHTDHVLTRNAALKLSERLRKKLCSIYLYEDLPYAWYEDVVSHALRLPVQDKPILMDIHRVIESKIKLIANYKTQIGPDEINKVNGYARSIIENRIMERLWQLKE